MAHKIEDSVINWDHVHEREMPIEHEIQRTIANITLISQNIAILAAGEGLSEHLPRKDDLIAALTYNLDAEYVMLDRLQRVKAIKDLDLPTYVPKVRKSRKKNTSDALGDFNSILAAFQKKNTL